MWRTDGSLDRTALRVRVDHLVKGFDESFFYERRRAVRGDAESAVLIVGTFRPLSERCEQLFATRLAFRVDVLQLGFAALRFPDAHVVHACFATAEPDGTSDLAFLRDQHRRLMAHWYRVLPLRFHEWRSGELQ